MIDPRPDHLILDEVAIESPCLVPWDEIAGEGQVRSCSTFRKDVFDLIEMTTVEAARILAEGGPLPCVRICRAPDGRIVTADNAMGPGMGLWTWLRRRSGILASLFALLFLPGCSLINSLFSYGAPMRSIVPRDPGRTITDAPAVTKEDTGQGAAPAD